MVFSAYRIPKCIAHLGGISSFDLKTWFLKTFQEAYNLSNDLAQYWIAYK